MKVALVYDRVNKWGGAERVLLALHAIWPDAPLYTSVYDPKGAPWASVFDVRPSFLQRIPFAKNHHELFPWLTPLAFESFSFDGFDTVISITSAEAKGIITKPDTLHICYCLTPTRYLWSGYKEYQEHPGLGRLGRLGAMVLRKLAPVLRSWDFIASSRPDVYVAISRHVADRIKRYYQREVAEVIYPPVDLHKFRTPAYAKAMTGKQNSSASWRINDQSDYFLTVSRLVGYKRVDLLIDAFNRLGLPLKIIGKGSALHALQGSALHGNIEFIDRYLTDEELTGYYQRCRAFVFAGQEDFGLVAIEAQACGKPVICYKKSGMAEAVKDAVTGVFFENQSVESLIGAIEQFQGMRYNEEIVRDNVIRFDVRQFTKTFQAFVQKKFAAHHTRKA